MSATESTSPEVTEIEVAHDAHHPSDGQYVKIAAILAVITGLEVSTYFLDLNNGIIASLYVMMTAKFAVVVGYFMHLKYDSRIFRFMFVGGLVLAVIVYLITFNVFGFFVGDHV